MSTNNSEREGEYDRPFLGGGLSASRQTPKNITPEV